MSFLYNPIDMELQDYIKTHKSKIVSSAAASFTTDLHAPVQPLLEPKSCNAAVSAMAAASDHVDGVEIDEEYLVSK